MPTESKTFIPTTLVQVESRSVLDDPVLGSRMSLATIAPSFLKEGEKTQRGIIPTEAHGRSFEVVSPLASEPFKLPRDITPSNAWISSIVVKGGTWFTPEIVTNRNAPPTIERVNGFYDLLQVEKAAKVSGILLQQGYPTDWVIDARRLLCVRVDREEFDIKEFIEYLIGDLALKENEQGMYLYSRTQLEQFRKQIEQEGFGLLISGKEVSERFADFAEGDFVDFLTILHRSIDFNNFKEREGAKLEERSPEYFLYEGNYPFRYIMEEFPQQLAHAYGRLHGELGVIHQFANAHSQNWLTTGVLTDLDGMKGEILGDRPIKQFEVAYDLQRILSHGAHRYDLGTVLTKLFTRGMLTNEKGQLVSDENDIYKFYQRFLTNFLKTYKPYVEGKFPGMVDAFKGVKGVK